MKVGVLKRTSDGFDLQLKSVTQCWILDCFVPFKAWRLKASKKMILLLQVAVQN